MLTAPSTHSFLGPLLTQVFQELDVGATVWRNDRWHGLHWRSDLFEFEMEHGAEARRSAHNRRCLARARKKRSAVLAEHAGLFDLFVPVQGSSGVAGVIVAGPFALAHSSASELMARWRELTGRQGHPADPFEQVAEAVLGGRALDAKNLAELRITLDTTSNNAGTVHELFAAYRRAMADLVLAVERRGRAKIDHNLRRAEEYLRQNYASPLTLRQVARVAGFAPNYFSTLFHKKQGVTLERYILDLRLRRAKGLLSTTALGVDRLAKLCGFSGGHYLARVFRRANGETPLQYRKHAQLAKKR